MYLRELKDVRAQLAVGTMALSHVINNLIVDNLKRADKAACPLVQAELRFLEGCRDLDDAIEKLENDDIGENK